MKTQSTLEQLIAGCRNNDRKSQEAIYKLYARPMFAVCRRYAEDTAEAEDILQEAFIKVFTRLDSYNGNGSFEGWVRMIVINTGISAYRKNKTIAAALRQVELDESVQMHEYDGESTLLATIKKLPANLLMPFTMHALEGRSHKEIAAKTGITEMQSKVNLSRARACLRNTLTISTYN